MALDQHNACQSGAAGEPADDRHKQDHALNGDQDHDAKMEASKNRTFCGMI